MEGCFGMYVWCGEGSGHSCQIEEVYFEFQLPCMLVLALLDELGLFVQFLSLGLYLPCMSPSLSSCPSLSASDFQLLSLSLPLALMHSAVLLQDCFWHCWLLVLVNAKPYHLQDIQYPSNCQNQFRRLSVIPFVMGNYSVIKADLFIVNSSILPSFFSLSYLGLFLQSLVMHKLLNRSKTLFALIIIPRLVWPNQNPYSWDKNKM